MDNILGGWRRIAALAVAIVAIPAFAHPVAPDAVVGVWLVQHPTAPFPLHLYVFNADHTMQQANPDAGNSRSSDSDGKGVWQRRGEHVVGKWVEIMADRTTHKLTGHGELSFDLTISANRMVGKGTFIAFDTAGNAQGEPIDAPFTGTRITTP